jgi:thymidylate kinase
MTTAAIAAVVDDAAGEPVLVVGSLPPDGRDLDLLVNAAGHARIGAALDAAGCLRRGRSYALLAAGSAEVVDVVAASSWGVSDDELTAAFAAAQPIEGYRNLVRPSPAHVLLLTARRLGHSGRLDERRRDRVASALAEDPVAWDAARARAAAWHVGEALEALRTTYVTRVDPPQRVVARLVAERERGRGRARLVRLRPRRRIGHRGAVVAISGLDGSGKSTQGQLLADTLGALGVDAVVEWRRLAQGSGLDAIAVPVKKLLRRARGKKPEQTVAVHYSRTERDSASQLRQRSTLLTFAWSLVVTATHIRSQRAAVVPHLRAGRVVVCDRYTLDSVVTLRFRYGAGRLQTALVRLLTPRAIRAYYLDITPEESLRRKDDGYAVSQLRTMHALYATAWAELGVTRLDGTRTAEDLATQIARDVWPTLP